MRSVVGEHSTERGSGEVANIVEDLVGFDPPTAEERDGVGALVTEETLVADGVERDRFAVGHPRDGGGVGRGQAPPSATSRATRTRTLPHRSCPCRDEGGS
jgi:hypothetical protein